MSGRVLGGMFCQGPCSLAGPTRTSPSPCRLGFQSPNLISDGSSKPTGPAAAACPSPRLFIPGLWGFSEQLPQGRGYGSPSVHIIRTFIASLT